MRGVILVAGAVIPFFTSTVFAQGPTLPEIAKKAKAATALVEVANGFKHGSAFCVHDSGIYLSNEHVVRGTSEVKLILHPGLKTQEVVNARVLRVNKDLDLALLRVADKVTHAPLPIGSSDDLVELTEIIAVGFPFGKALAEKGEYPAVSVNTGRISALRLKKGELERIQMDAVVNPGNSGGPVLDTKGNVVGVVVSGVPGATVNFAIPASHVQKFVAVPEIEVVFPSIVHADRHKPAMFQVRTVAIVPSKEEYKVELILGDKGKPQRTIPMTLSEGLYRATAKVLEPEAAPKSVRVTLTYADGSVQGQADNHALTIGKEKLTLAQLRSLRFDKIATAILANGKTVTGPLKDFDELNVKLGDELIKLNPAKARELVMHLPAAESSVAYTVIVRRGNEVVARIEDALAFRDVPSTIPSDATKVAIAAPTLDADLTTVKLPAVVDDLCVGGNGRYLVLYFSKIRSLGIFDVSQARLAHTVPLSPGEVVFAAGMDKLVVAYPGTNVYARYSLATGERELMKTIEFKDKVLTMAMGSASNGPLLVGGPSSPDDEWLRVKFLDLDLQVLKTVVKDPIVIGFRNEGKLGVRASANGRTFAMWAPKSRPSHLQTVLYEPGMTKIFGNRDHCGSAVPSHYGAIIHTSWAGHFTYQAKPIDGSKDNPRVTSLPAHGYPYHFRLPTADRGTIKEVPAKGMAIYLNGESRPIANVPLTDDVPDNLDSWGQTAITADKRFHFVPDAKVIISIPKTDDRLHLQRFDMEAALSKADFDFLFVTSTPPASARRGETLQYAIQTRSKRGGTTCKLLSGPPDLKVTPTGDLSWAVPMTQEAGDVDVVITIADLSQQEIFHNFKLSVR